MTVDQAMPAARWQITKFLIDGMIDWGDLLVTLVPCGESVQAQVFAVGAENPFCTSIGETEDAAIESLSRSLRSIADLVGGIKP